jgi:enamine deaminase RidA (YjgF/YER057c/UK114 family)
MLKLHAPKDAFAPIAPYAQAIEVVASSRLLFISGTMGLQPDGRLAQGFEAQCEWVWKNIEATLRSAHMTFANLAKLTVWLAHREDWRLAAEIRQRYLGDHKVAMSVVEVRLVDPDWLIEVEAVAAA